MALSLPNDYRPGEDQRGNAVEPQDQRPNRLPLGPNYVPEELASTDTGASRLPMPEDDE